MTICGVAVRVGAKAPAFSPLSLGALAWLDASALNTLWQDIARTSAVSAAGQSVALGDDRTGNGRAQKQSGAGQRPTYVVTSGIPGLSFDGVDDYMETDSFSWGSALGHEMWIVFTPATSEIGLKFLAAKQTTIYTEADATCIYSYRASGSPPQIWSYRSNAGGLSIDNGGGLLGASTRRVTRFGLDNSTNPDTIINWLDGVNGTEQLVPHIANSTSTNGSAKFRLALSGTSAFDVVIHEAVAFPRALTTAEANQMQAYCKAKWSTP